MDVMTARDLFGVAVRVIGLIIVISAIVGIAATVLDFTNTERRFGLSLPIDQIAILLSPSLAALLGGLLLLFGAGFLVRLVYGRARPSKPD